MRRGTLFLILFAATAASAQDTNFAVRISCDFQQQAGAAELPDLTLLQGSAPMIQAAPMRMGRAVAADSLTTCQLVFGPSATSTYYVATNAYLATNSAYYVQLGTIGTNSVPAGSNSPAAWWYSILYYRNGGIYWSGSGRLYIERTTATGANGLVWQEWEAGAAKDDIARGWIADLSNVVDSIEVGGVNYGTATNEAYRGDWGAAVSNAVNEKYTFTNTATFYGQGDYYHVEYVTNALGESLDSAFSGYYFTSWKGASGTNYVHNQTASTNCFFNTATGAWFLADSHPENVRGNWDYMRPTGSSDWIDTNGNVCAVSVVFGSVTGATSKIGYENYAAGRFDMWANSLYYLIGTNVYDNAVDIFFGRGTNVDSSIRWTLSSRPSIPRPSGHDYGEFAIFEGPASGVDSRTVKRLGVVPDSSGNHGSLFLGYAPIGADIGNCVSNSILTVADRRGNADAWLVAGETAGTNRGASLNIKAGTNVLRIGVSGNVYSATMTYNGASIIPATNTTLTVGGLSTTGTVAATNLTVRDLTANGDLTMLGRDVKSRDANGVGDYGAAFGDSTSAGSHGFAAGVATSAGNYGAAFGADTTAGEFGAAFGTQNRGGAQSFIFSDYEYDVFDRTNFPNSFSLRVAGGIYAEIGTNVFAVSNAVTMNGVELGAGGGSGISAAEAGQIATNVTTAAIAASNIAEGTPQALALADGFVTIWSTGLWEQAYTAAGAATVRVVKANATNSAALIWHATLSNFPTFFITNNLLGFTATGIDTNGGTTTISLRSKPGSTNWTWSVDLP